MSTTTREAVMNAPLRSLPFSDQIAVRERARELVMNHQGAGILTMLEAVTQARRELGI